MRPIKRVAESHRLARWFGYADDSFVVVVGTTRPLARIRCRTRVILIRCPRQRAVHVIAVLDVRVVLVLEMGYLPANIIFVFRPVPARILHLVRPVPARAAGVVIISRGMICRVGVARRSGRNVAG